MKKLFVLLFTCLFCINAYSTDYNFSNTTDLTYQRNATDWWLNVTGLSDSIVNIRAYGAIGDGITNDTIAFSNAIDASIAGNKSLYIPSGTFLVTGLVKTIDSCFSIIGDSPTTSIISNGTEMSISKSFEVQNIGFDNWRGAGSGYPFILNVSSGGINGILVDHVKVTNCTGFIYSNWGINDGNIISNVHIINNYFGNIYRYGIRLYAALRNIDISHNTFENMLGPTASTAIALGDSTYANSSRVTIQSNQISNLTGITANEVHAILYYGTYSLIDSNEIYNLSDGTDHEPIYFKGNHNKVSNNIINSDSGIGSHGAIYAGGNLQEHGHNIISKNIITSPTSANNGIAVVGGATITDNIIECPVTGGGILGEGDNSDYTFIVSGNKINVTDNGIVLQDSKNSIVERNIVKQSSGSSDGVGFTRVNTTTNNYSAENITFNDNYIESNSTSGWNVNFAGTYPSDLKMKGNTFIQKGNVARMFQNLDTLYGGTVIKDNTINGIINGTLSNTSTPDLYQGFYPIWITGGTTNITDFDGGFTGEVIVILAEHNLTITSGTNIFLSGSTNFTMAATDTLTLIQKADGKWYELSRSDNT